MRKRRNGEIDTFKKDLKDFAVSAAGHMPGLGEALATRDTYLKAKRLAGSTQKALRVVKRRAKSRINRTARRMRRPFS